MENDNLNKLWDIQANDISKFNPKEIITKAKKQRNSQYISIIVMSLTVMILITYTYYYAFSKWNTFNLGLILMISSLTLRIILELFFLYRKEKQLISMSQKAYRNYLKKYYNVRKMINYIITPICVLVYIMGFYLLLPYFKKYFPQAFYNYLVISGILSLIVVIAIIVNSSIKELRFLKQLNK
jgi:Kef-type K+ transport system membrane component KefB